MVQRILLMKSRKLELKVIIKSKYNYVCCHVYY